MSIIVVSRHPGAVEWLRQHGVVGPVLSQVESIEQVHGKIVVGNIPLHLAQWCAEVRIIDLPGLSREQRGKDLSPEEMDAAGAALRTYRVAGPDVPRCSNCLDTAVVVCGAPAPVELVFVKSGKVQAFCPDCADSRLSEREYEACPEGTPGAWSVFLDGTDTWEHQTDQEVWRLV